MSRRRLLLVGVLVAVVVLGVGGWLLYPKTAITRENAAKIQIGMTLAEVEAILGGPERDDSTGPVVSDLPVDAKAPPLPPKRFLTLGHIDSLRPLEWRSNEALIVVQVDPHQERVILCAWFQRRRIDESPLDRLRRWLHL